MTSVTACGGVVEAGQAPRPRRGSARASARWRPPSRRRRPRRARCRCRSAWRARACRPAGRPPWSRSRSGCTRPCTARPKIGSSERMVWPPATTPPASATTAGGGGEDGADRLDRHALGERGDVEGEHDPAAHGEHVAARVGGGDGAEVRRVVDERREEVGRRHERDVVAQPVDRGVVERRQADEQVAVGRRPRAPSPARRAATRPTSRRSRRTTSTRSA